MSRMLLGVGTKWGETWGNWAVNSVGGSAPVWEAQSWAERGVLGGEDAGVSPNLPQGAGHPPFWRGSAPGAVGFA